MIATADLGFVCLVDDISEGSSRGFTHQGINLFVVRQGDNFYVYRNLCPHELTPLEWDEHQFLDDSGTMIQCANHGALFVIQTGSCVTGPCQGQQLQPLQYQIINNELWIASP